MYLRCVVHYVFCFYRIVWSIAWSVLLFFSRSVSLSFSLSLLCAFFYLNVVHWSISARTINWDSVCMCLSNEISPSYTQHLTSIHTDSLHLHSIGDVYFFYSSFYAQLQIQNQPQLALILILSVWTMMYYGKRIKYTFVYVTVQLAKTNSEI